MKRHVNFDPGSPIIITNIGKEPITVNKGDRITVKFGKNGKGEVLYSQSEDPKPKPIGGGGSGPQQPKTE